MTNLKMYGIKTIKINNFTAYTYNIRINNNSDNLQSCKKSGLHYWISEDNKIQLNELTTNSKEFNNKVSQLGKLLKEVAQTNLNKKYSWI
tara:strand:- start:704 stop:973 length:270 start_codon:yes stop_codon:yes gene_type:complete